MKHSIYIVVMILMIPLSLQAAAPNDINTNQRAWYDAADINANQDYTDNPANNASISQWNDKSGNNNHLFQNNSASQPRYRIDNLGTQRNGVDFDGTGDNLDDNDDIWTGSSVNSSEIFIATTTDQVKNSSIFSSASNGTNRLNSHIPWGNNQTFFDQGACCGNPTRLRGNISITLNQQYFWHFIGHPTQQSVLQDGVLRLNDAGASTYIINAASRFSLAAYATANNNTHHGRIFESIFYQGVLNNAQRRIISSYLSAKWNKAFGSNPIYADIYMGDTTGNGNYDFFVGGIGQDSGTQTTGTSQGLTITNNSFLTANGKFIVAGVDYLVTTPTIGVTTSNLPEFYINRSNRSWYIDRTGNGGLVNLAFNASDIGITAENGETYGLLHRTSTTGVFTPVATATMSAGVVSFSHLPADGVYTIGRIDETIQLSLQKTSKTSNDPVNGTNNPKAIPGSHRDYTLVVKNNGNSSPDNNSTLIKDVIPDQLTLFTGNLDGNGSPFIFTDNNCPPLATTLSSNLTLNYPTDVVFKDVTNASITPSSNYDSAIRSFEITLSGLMNVSSAGNTPCFTVEYRTRLE